MSTLNIMEMYEKFNIDIKKCLHIKGLKNLHSSSNVAV